MMWLLARVHSCESSAGAGLRAIAGVACAGGLLVAGVLTAPAAAADDDAAQTRVMVGVLAHDRGFSADNHEDGIDPNIEIRFRPPGWAVWEVIGSPRPHLGVTPNFNGDTSAAYGGITYHVPLAGRLFANFGGGLAVHDGPLHKADVDRCKIESDCGFGARVLLHGSFDLGVELGGGRSISFYFDHMSHGQLFDDENEGIEHVGVRYGFGF